MSLVMSQLIDQKHTVLHCYSMQARSETFSEEDLIPPSPAQPLSCNPAKKSRECCKLCWWFWGKTFPQTHFLCILSSKIAFGSQVFGYVCAMFPGSDW